MKIAVVIERYDPAAGGNERSTHQIVRRLVERGHDVTVLTGDSPTGHGPEGFAVERGGGRTRSSGGLRRFADWAEARVGDFDVSLSVTMAVPATVMQPRGGTVRETLAANARRFGSGRALKAVAQALRPKNRVMLARERRTLTHRRVKRIVSISRYVTRQLTEHYAVPADRIAEIPNAAAIEPMDDHQRADLRAVTRKVWQLADDDVAFLFAALNPALKGRGELLAAMGKLVAEQPRARLLIAGGSGYRDSRRAAASGLAEHLRWVGPTQRMDALYCAADVTVLATWYDPSSKVVLESLLHGVPAISTRYNGASDWITQRDAGRVIDTPADIDALAGAMGELCDGDERARCAANTAGLAEHIHMDAHVAALEKVLIGAAG